MTIASRKTFKPLSGVAIGAPLLLCSMLAVPQNPQGEKLAAIQQAMATNKQKLA